jgi:hypothetical protein
VRVTVGREFGGKRAAVLLDDLLADEQPQPDPGGVKVISRTNQVPPDVKADAGRLRR